MEKKAEVGVDEKAETAKTRHFRRSTMPVVSEVLKEMDHSELIYGKSLMPNPNQTAQLVKSQK